MLHRYWFTFHDEQCVRFGLGQGCGVTALNLNDAVGLLEQHVFGGPLPFAVASVTEDVDVSSLDPGHVLRNMLPPNWRGI